MAQQSQPDDLATALARMARDLLAQETVQHTLDRIVEHAVALVDGCEAAGIVTVDSGTPRTLAATNRLATESDRIQAELGEGPCLDDTLPEARMYRVEDMATERRWPGYASKAQEAGIGSAMGFLLYTRDRQLGALNTTPPPSEVRAMLEKEQASDRVIGRDEPKHVSPEVKQKTD